MSKIDEMIRELCPEGVERVKLGDVCNTVTPPTKLKTNEYQSEGEYVIIDQGLNAYAGFTNNEGALLPIGEYVLYGDHTCSVKYVNEPFAQGADGLKILKANNIECKYLYYAICVYNLDNTEYKRHWTQAKEIIIPLPPLSIQQEIVSVLDSFTTLIDKMKQEVEKRKKQMGYYREELLTFEDGKCEWKTLGEATIISRGKRVVRKDLLESGSIPVYQNSLKPLGFANESNNPANTPFIISAGAAGEVGYSLTEYWGADDCFSILSEYSNSKFIYYWLKIKESFLQSRIRGGAIKRLSRDIVENLPIPIIPITKQREIVSTLDKFESYISKLEKMITLRQKQYEYYRERLLTF